jgi:hypothetical protein
VKVRRSRVISREKGGEAVDICISLYKKIFILLHYQFQQHHLPSSLALEFSFVIDSVATTPVMQKAKRGRRCLCLTAITSRRKSPEKSHHQVAWLLSHVNNSRYDTLLYLAPLYVLSDTPSLCHAIPILFPDLYFISMARDFLARVERTTLDPPFFFIASRDTWRRVHDIHTYIYTRLSLPYTCTTHDYGAAQGPEDVNLGKEVVSYVRQMPSLSSSAAAWSWHVTMSSRAAAREAETTCCCCCCCCCSSEMGTDFVL